MSEVTPMRSTSSLEEGRRLISRAPLLGLLVLWLFAVALALWGLGDLPLRDFDEGTVARVAFELSHKEGLEKLLPTLWDSHYLNKPPGLHWLIALVMQISQGNVFSNGNLPSEFVVRFAPALLSTFVVPFGGLIQWHLCPRNGNESLATAAILLTLMPVARHGRLAMLDGPQLSAIALLWLLLLAIDKTPLDRWRAWGAGLACSSMLLMKAPLLLPALIAALGPMLFGKELRSFWRFKTFYWLILGLLPGVSWHLWNVLQRGSGAFWLWWGDGAGRVLFDAGSGSDLGWRVPLIEILEGGWPWLVLWPVALLWAWHERQSRWGRWVLFTQAVFALAILPLRTQLPWYSHPLWLPFALFCGKPFGWLINRRNPRQPPGKSLLIVIPYLWLSLGMILIFLGSLGITGLVPVFHPYSAIALASGIGWTVGGLLLTRPLQVIRRLGAISMVAGNLAGLFILMGSPLWLWELNEHWQVAPVVKLLSRTDMKEVVIDGDFERPSLNWYAQRRIHIDHPSEDALWIITSKSQEHLSMKLSRDCKSVDKERNWTLFLCGN